MTAATEAVRRFPASDRIGQDEANSPANLTLVCARGHQAASLAPVFAPTWPM
jgi:hypothetical protein